MTANPRPPRASGGDAADHPRTWARTTLLPVGIAAVTLAMIVALGLPVNAASHDAWPLSGKRVTTGSSAKGSQTPKSVSPQIEAGRIADAVPNPSGATLGTTVAASIPSSTSASSSTTKSGTGSSSTTRSAVAAPTAPPTTATATPTTAPPPPPPTTTTPPPPAAGAVCSALGEPSSRQSLLNQVSGFARVAGTSGAGLGGATYVVTSTADRGAGSLRDGLQAGNRWVIFSPSAFPVGEERVIRVESPIMVGANTTLDGRCANVRLDGSTGTDGILMIGNYGYSGTSNVMLSTLRVGPVPGNGGSQSGDGIRVVWGSDRFFISHVEVFSAEDEAIEITRGDRGAMRGTVANSLIRDTQKAVLVGDGTANNEKQGGWATNAHRIQVTFRDNWFLRNQVRNPLITDSSAHIVNNYVSAYGLAHTPENGAGIEMGGNAWVWAESNAIEQASPTGDYCGLDAVDYGSLGVTGITYLNSIGNAFRGIAKTCAFGPQPLPIPIPPPYAYNAQSVADGGAALIARLTSGDPNQQGRAGWVAVR
jgi:pectate lyase